MSIPVTADTLDRLQRLRQDRKFAEEGFYPGAQTEGIRVSCECRVNGFLAEIARLLRGGTEPEDVYAQARVLVGTFAEEDTEERERADDYIGEAMRIIGLEDWTEHV